MSGLQVVSPGILSLIQDRGRRGYYRIGLTDGGPMDPQAHDLCNRLLQNAPEAATVEVTLGGLEVDVGVDTWICVTGAPVPLAINGNERPGWQVLKVASGDRIQLGHAEYGCRAYLGVADGFRVTPVFGSCATVAREGLGGLNGERLQTGDLLPCHAAAERRPLRLPPAQQPRYPRGATLRVIPGYQEAHFPRLEQRRFYASAFSVSQRADRMGYRLEGPMIECDIDGILSEGICQGAIQIPADGQPIVLLNDRQTIGGYPKIGSALSLDCAQLAQQTPGAPVHFVPISQHDAHNALHLAKVYEANRQLQEYRP